MANANNSVETQQEIEKLHEQINKGAEETKSYLALLTEKLQEYDAHYKVTETATSYMQSGMDRVHASVEELKQMGERVKQQSKSTSDSLIESTQASLQKVQASLDDLKTRARDYDQRVRTSVTSTVSSSVATAQGTIETAKGTVANSIESIVSTTRQTTTSTLESATAQLQRVRDTMYDTAVSAGQTAMVATGGAVIKAEQVDEMYGVRGTIAGTVAAVSEKVKEVDQKFGLLEKASKLDEKVSGGMGAQLMNRGLDFMQHSVDYVSETLHQAKVAASEHQKAEEKTTPAPEAAAAATTDANVEPTKTN
ncbi:TPA: hypothetical protein N0F65_001348 [Lagenidium giganteum]|uniref:Uncharacterized protein n=1 Tax=Lagenidium giganteum TaxID=4803 RepID=A0AAV2Z2H2_9STRA|nr:TPA: hypothetical protein N0F65_001348 [Lagenidium giganteum]